MSMDQMNIRFDEESDCAVILSFIRHLAEYEKMTDRVVATEELLRECCADRLEAVKGRGFRQLVTDGFKLIQGFPAEPGADGAKRAVSAHRERLSSSHPPAA